MADLGLEQRSVRVVEFPDYPSTVRGRMRWLARVAGLIVRGKVWRLRRLQATARLAVLIRAWQMQSHGPYDVVHAHFGRIAEELACMRACGWLDAPVLVASLHGYDVTRAKRDFDYRFLPGWTDVVLVTTQFMRDKAMALGCKGSQLQTFTLGVDTDRFQPAGGISEDAVPTILTVSRLVKQKGLSYGLQALRRLHDAGIDCCYQVIGDGPDREALLSEAQELGVAGAVSWEGAQPVGRVRESMQRATVFLFPTIRTPAGDEEAQGVVLLESQASGVPVIATRCGGVPEVVAPTMWLVEERDVDGLVRSLGEVLCMSAEQRRLRGLDARTWVERNFAMSTQWRVLEGLYLDVLQGDRSCA